MKKQSWSVGFAIISYDSIESALKLIESAVFSKIDLSIWLCENSECVITQDQLNQIESLKSNTKLIVKRYKNPGYFGAAQKLLEEEDQQIRELDYFMVGNADLSFSSDFFEKLASVDLPDGIGLIAPSILSDRSQSDQNPLMRHRPSLRRMKQLELIFSFWPVGYVYQLARILKYEVQKQSSKPQMREACEIYAGHGSLFVFTKAFFLKGGDLKHPNFLFGEEIFVAEKLRSLSLKAWYQPTLKVHHVQHETLGLWPSLQKLRWLKEATSHYPKYYRN